MAEKKRGLTVRFCETAGPGKHADGEGRGLMLVASEGGGRRWVQRIMIRGRRRDLGLGSLREVSLAEAREAAARNRRIARAGGDPLADRRAKAEVPTFEEAAREVHQLRGETWKNPKHRAQFLATLETYAFPKLGGLKVNAITPADALAVLTPIWTAKPETARRVKQRVGVVLDWCVAKGWRTDNAVDALKLALPRTAKTKAHHRALPYREVAACIAAVKASGALLSSKLCLEFLVLTAARSGEARGAVWAEIDLDEDGEHGGAVWTIPAARMKAQRPHRVPLPPRAVEILKEARALSGGGPAELTFPGMVRGKPLSDATLNKLLRENGLDAVIHGFRSSFRDWAAEQTNIPREVAERALAHAVRDATEAAYARSDLFAKRRALMAAWAQYLAASAPADVIDIADRRGR